MIEFLLNNTVVRTSLSAGTSVLHHIRQEARLIGSKLACGEGECGACTVLVGQLEGQQVRYKSMTSCITPLANVRGKHVVTIEGLNLASTSPMQPTLSPVQQAMVDENGTQCGFCTPGFVVSFTGALISVSDLNFENLLAHIDGNICRCTGYKSIERAAEKIADLLKDIPENGRTNWLAKNKFIPDYFREIPKKLTQLKVHAHTAATPLPLIPLTPFPPSTLQPIGGGSDLLVQQPYAIPKSQIDPLYDHAPFKGINISGTTCKIGASATMTDLQYSTALQKILPGIKDYFAPIGSTLIRNMATVGGNLVNASPIGDTTIMFLALNAEIILKSENAQRQLPLKDFYLGYKEFDLQNGEQLAAVVFNVPNENAGFYFHRVCKREYLDIASVNSACFIEFEDDGRIKNIGISAGGVAPIPKYLSETCDFLLNKVPEIDTLNEALEIANAEISPISDIRGSEKYKRLLLRQIIKLHFTKLAPEFIKPELIFAV